MDILSKVLKSVKKYQLHEVSCYVFVYYYTAEQVKLMSRSGARSAGSNTQQRHLGTIRNMIVTPEIPIQLTTTAERAQWFRALQIALKHAQSEGRGTP